MTPVPHPTQHLDLTPSNLFVCLFPWIKKVLKGKCFTNVEEVKQKMAEALKGIKINEFKSCCEQWKKKYLSRVLHQVDITLQVTEV